MSSSSSEIDAVLEISLSDVLQGSLDDPQNELCVDPELTPAPPLSPLLALTPVHQIYSPKDPVHEWHKFKGQWETAKGTLPREEWLVFKQRHMHLKGAHKQAKKELKDAKKLYRLLEKCDGDVELFFNIVEYKSQRM